MAHCTSLSALVSTQYRIATELWRAAAYQGQADENKAAPSSYSARHFSRPSGATPLTICFV
jgi:hypothetical protein